MSVSNSKETDEIKYMNIICVVPSIEIIIHYNYNKQYAINFVPEVAENQKPPAGPCVFQDKSGLRSNVKSAINKVVQSLLNLKFT